MVTVTQVNSATLSSDADLSALTLSGVSFGTFAAATTDYTANVANSVSSTTLAATPSDEYAAVHITPSDSDADTDGHQIDLAEGQNPITISVTSTNGQVSKEYRVAVNRSSDGDFGWVPTKDIDLTTIKSNISPEGLWSDGTTMWVTNGGGRIFAFDPSDMTRVSSSDIRTFARGQREPGAIWSDGETMWVVDWDETTWLVFAYDLDDGTRDNDSEIDIPPSTRNKYPSAIWSDGDTLWLADFLEYKVFAYDLDDGNRISGSDIDTIEDAGNKIAHRHVVRRRHALDLRPGRQKDLRLHPRHRPTPAEQGLRHPHRRRQRTPHGHLVRRHDHVGHRQGRQKDLRLQHAVVSEPVLSQDSCGVRGPVAGTDVGQVCSGGEPAGDCD